MRRSTTNVMAPQYWNRGSFAEVARSTVPVSFPAVSCMDGQPGGNRDEYRCTAVRTVVPGRQLVTVEARDKPTRNAASGPGKWFGPPLTKSPWRVIGYTPESAPHCSASLNWHVLSVGPGVGAGVGTGLGCYEGTGDGTGLGTGIGCSVGTGDGKGVGSGVGAGVGCNVGTGLGSGEGTGDGRGEGKGVGRSVGRGVGSGVGSGDGAGLGTGLGTGVG